MRNTSLKFNAVFATRMPLKSETQKVQSTNHKFSSGNSPRNH